MIGRRLLRIKVLKELFSFLTPLKASLDIAEKNLICSIGKTYDLYHLLMILIVAIADHARQQQDLGRQKNVPTEAERNPNTKFVDNSFVALLAAHKGIDRYCDRHRLTWTYEPELVKKLYNLLTSTSYYATYMANAERSFEEDKELVITFYEQELEDVEELHNLLEEQSIYWTDDLEFTLSQVIKTLRTFTPTEAPLMPLYKDVSDELFARNLLLRTASNIDHFQELIDKHTKNWDVDRIAFMDNVIMVTAIAEIVEFQTIPVKVSLNEYIEIAKYYSTPNSSTFINGVLDKVVEELNSTNQIVKVGRGLTPSG